MKNLTLASSIFVAFLLFNATTAHGTVGGPTLIESLQYSSASKQNIIYQLQSYSGKGCPEEIYSLNVATGAKQGLITCNDPDFANPSAYNSKLESLLAQYPSLLRHLDLSKNKITGQVTVTGEKKFEPEAGYFGGTDFRLDIFQDRILKGSATYSGCSRDQIHIVEGHVIPNYNSLIVLVSTKGDCFEGGYANEKLYVISNITLYDQAPLPLKGEKAATNAKGNLVLIASTNIAPGTPGYSAATTAKPVLSSAPSPISVNETPTSDVTDNFFVYQMIIGGLFVIIVILILKKR